MRIARFIDIGSTERYSLSALAILHVDFVVTELIIFDSDGVQFVKFLNQV